MTRQHQPEALRLADWLDHMMNGTFNYNSVPKAATELRRLHAENAALQAGYDELLEALALMLELHEASGMPNGATAKRARAAIAKATGETK